MTELTSNKVKIMYVLNHYKVAMPTNDLCDFTGISIKNIGRYLKKLENINFITRETIQNGQLRYRVNKITKIGIKDSIKREISDELKGLKLKKKYAPKMEIPSGKAKKKVAQKPKTNEILFAPKEVADKIFENTIEPKADLITLLNRLVIREIDAKKLGFENSLECRKHINKMVLDL